MYHIKEDKRALKSAELLYQGLIKCIGEKEFHKITVTDIANASTVGRATFYRNFDDIIDVLYWKCNQQFSEVLNTYIAQHPYTDKKSGLLLHVFSYWVKNSEVIELLLLIKRIDIIYKCFYENAYIVVDYLKKEVHFLDSHYDYFISVRIGIFIGVIHTWINNGKKESAEELTEIIIDQLRMNEKSSIII